MEMLTVASVTDEFGVKIAKVWMEVFPASPDSPTLAEQNIHACKAESQQEAAGWKLG